MKFMSWHVTYHDYCDFPIINYITNNYELSAMYICLVEDKAEKKKNLYSCIRFTVNAYNVWNENR